MRLPFGNVAACLLIVTVFAPGSRAAEVSDLAEVLRKVQSDGTGNQAAAEAWQSLMKASPSDLPTILGAIDGADPLAANWLRSAVDTIAERTVAKSEKLPVDALAKFLMDTNHDPRARRLAFEWVRRVDREAAAQIIPQLLNDPSVELRRDAVGRLTDQAVKKLEAGEEAEATKLFKQSLAAARDNDQVKTIVARLDKLGQKVDLQKHFGFLTKWRVIGPFDNSRRAGFEAVYPPEFELDADSQYGGKDGDVAWVDYTTKDEYGMVDLNEPLGSLKETVAYAWTDYYSDGEQDVELRLGCKNAWKVWLNGELLFGRDEYHRGMTLDQYRLKCKLKPGKNQILVKACQNEQNETWTVEWQFQLRVCDSTGTAILSAE